MVKIFSVILFFLFQLSFAQIDSIKYYFDKGEKDKAINYGEYWNNFFVKNDYEVDENYLSLISRLAILYDEKNDKSNANKYFNILEKNLNKLEKNYEFLRQSKYYLGKFNFDENNYDKAILFLSQVRDSSIINELSDIIFFNSLYYLIEIDKFIFKNNRLYYSNELSEHNVLLMKNLCEKLFSKNSKDYIIATNDLGLHYLRNNQFLKSEKLFLEAFSIAQNNQFEDEIIISALDNLTKFYLTINNFKSADFYNNKGLSFVINKFGKKHKEYFSFLSNKAQIKTELGQNKEAVTLYDECIGLSKDLYGRESEIYGTMISNSVYPYLILGGSFENAEKLLLINYEITKKHNGLNSPKTAMCYTRLGHINMSMNKDEKAIQYYLKAIKIFNELNIKNLEYSTLLSNLGTFYTLTKDYEKAEKYYIESYDIKSQIQDKYNITSLISLNNFFQFYLKTNQINKHNKYLLEYFDVLEKNILEVNSSFGEKENIGFIKKYIPNNTYLSFFNLYPNNYPNINSSTFNNQLLLKNLTLRNQQRIKKSIEQSDDSVLKEKYEQFVANKRFLTKLEEQPIDKRPESYEFIKTKTENLEKDITRLSSTFAESKKSLLVTWQDIQQKLKPNEVVVDLVSYNYFNKKWTDSIMYGAFVFDKTSKFPKFVSLFEEKQLTQLLQRDSQAQESIQEKIINKQYANKSISDLFLKPLEQELQNAKTVYVTPSGLAHQINFKALPFQNSTFGETFSVHILGSSASVLSLASNHLRKNKNMEFHLFGGIDYNKVTREEILPLENEIVSRSSISSFGYLQGTEKEVNEISKTAQNQGFKTILKTERNATEESFKQLDGKKTPFVLHIATHGFFFENPKVDVKQFAFDNKFSVYKSSDDPMLRSGLAFAGANKNFKSTIIENESDDGILTAKEISNLDLSACELVVLSACETGLGDINGSEGVFGLQRAFKMAGAKNIIMSLWKVPDAQTSELFENFYKECFSGKSIKESFQVAQSKMKEKHSPYYWAGFVLLE